MCTDGNRPQCLVQLASEKEVEVVRPGSSSGVRERYLFAGVLPSLARQPRVFEACALPVVRDLFQGFNTLLFSYGVSNSGKTHTVQGSGDSPGMLPRSVLAIAQEVAGGTGEWAYQLYVSYFEVYNEMEDAPDLVNMSAAQIAALPRAALLLRSEGGRGNEAFVEGATEVRVRGARDLVRVLVHGQLRRAVHATGLNAGSSRSHAVFQAKLVKIRRAATVDPLDGVSASARASVRTMTVVDLAGSERAKRTHTQGERLAEAGKINVGLMTLKKCLDVKRFNAGLPDGDPGVQLVPYNESKVTRLFQPALEGGARTCMVVCVDP
ncbi:P-loop containing nucleoside triphosphate hydrolase protein, partial [Kickxella alabastrina]|uniref:P-loop containing nucleoside triphosphate hydrolase protein n=1 Tax=Kickxella alabastrina TaxID=61397 RepID=UPI00221FF4F7